MRSTKSAHEGNPRGTCLLYKQHLFYEPTSHNGCFEGQGLYLSNLYTLHTRYYGYVQVFILQCIYCQLCILYIPVHYGTCFCANLHQHYIYIHINISQERSKHNSIGKTPDHPSRCFSGFPPKITRSWS